MTNRKIGDDDTEAIGREGIVHVLLAVCDPREARRTLEAFDACRRTIRIHPVRSAGDALDFLHRRGRYADAPPISLVLLDDEIDRQTNGAVVDEIKNDPLLRRVPVAIMTDGERVGAAAAGARAGNADCVVHKPVGLSSFAEMVKLLDESRP